ncbi:MAG: AbrB/MazE/SpoVT family DNA-binding domain-containing protein [Candidatus Bathyarchaeota archaeon]|nr:MAG: AbrB/MazE/SpoVT family DNA-binding domain-containing protein [Candidatus Bathyarchaeota archaeon]
MGIRTSSGKDLKFSEMLESFFKTNVDSRGRIYLPRVVREKLSIKTGDKIYLKIQNDCIIVLTSKAVNMKIHF